MPDPNIAVFVSELRRGKTAQEALLSYCWARMAMPIDERAYANYRDYMECPPHYNLTMAPVMAEDCCDEGGSDEEIAAAFAEGLRIDRDRGVLWRAMRKDERPTTGQLMRAMPPEDRLKVADLFGTKAACDMLTSR